MPSYPGGIGLMLGIPHDGKPVALDWAFGFHSLHPPMNYDTRLMCVRGKPVAEAREEIAEAAVLNKCKYLFFLGTDNTCPPHTIRQLIFHLEHFGSQMKTHKGYKVAGAIYVHKSPPQMPMVFRGNGLGPYWDWKIGEVFDVSGLGMDMTLIDCSIFPELPKPWFKTVENLEYYKDGINKGEMWTEDLYFCKKVTDAGYGILADGGLIGGHWDNPSHTCYTLPLNSKPFRVRPTLGKKVVDLGCGTVENSYRTDETDNVVRVDIREEVEPEWRCDIRVTPFGNQEFDVVFSSHTLEHFTRVEAVDVVNEMVRILKPEGELRLVLPNMAWAAQHIVNNEVDMDVMNVLYGAQNYDENFHKCGYTPEMLEQFLRGKGFIKFKWDFEGYHMMVRAWLQEPKEETLMNPVYQFKRVEVAKMVEAAKEGDPTVEVRGNEVVVKSKEEQHEGVSEIAVPDAGDDMSAAVGAEPVNN